MKRILLVIGIVLFVLLCSHEVTHILANGGRLDGWCFLNCNPMRSGGLFGNGYTPIGLYLTSPIYPLATNEILPTFVSFTMAMLTYYLLTKKK